MKKIQAIVLFLALFGCGNSMNYKTNDVIHEGEITAYKDNNADDLKINNSVGLVVYDTYMNEDLVFSYKGKNVIYNYKDINELNLQLKPYAFDVDYNIVIFNVIEKHKNEFILTDSISLNRSKALKYYSWKEFILKYDYISLDISKCTLYSDEKFSISKSIQKENDPTIIVKPIKIKNNLMQIGWFDDGKRIDSAWIRWLKDETLLIDFIFLM